MRACVWYDVEEKIPLKTGYYLGFKGMSMGDDETKCDYYYWDARHAEWRDSELSQAHYANVIFWTEADPSDWYTNYYRMRTRNEVSVAEKDAWTAVQQAVEKYEMVKALTKT